jgi:regulator of sirC expression with transglutaminase-like and TPR domain
MNLSLNTPTPIEYFRSLVQSDSHFPLLESAVSLAQYEYPLLDVQQVLGEVDQMLARLKRRIPTDASVTHRLRMLNQLFFHELKFGGNLNDYYDPDNSYLHVVLHSRRGIPISLAVLWLELAQGLGLPAHGIGFPGHFMVTVSLSQGQVVMDPLTGLSLSRDELMTRLDAFGDGLKSPSSSEFSLSLYLQGASPREIIARMLRNLKEIHKTQTDWQRLVAVQDRMVLVLPQAWDEYRDRGLAHAELGQARAAVRDLQIYLSNVQTSHDRQLMIDRLTNLQRALG